MPCRRVLVASVWILVVLAGCGLVPSAPDPSGSFSDPTTAELARAVAAGDRSRVAQLVAGGADPDAAGTDGLTLLQWAVQTRSPDGLDALLAAGADPDRLGRGGLAALHDAAELEDDRYLRRLLESGADADVERATSDAVPLTNSCLVIRPATLEALVAGGADVNHVDRLGERPIRTCARTNAGGMVLRLLELGTDPRAANTRGATFQDYYFAIDPAVLNERARTERWAVIDWLRAHRVPVNPEAFR